MYIAVSTYLHREEVNHLRTSMAEAISCVDTDDNIVSMDDTINIDSSVSTIVWNDKHQIIFQNNNREWLVSVPFEKGKIREVNNEGETWLVYDNVVMDESRQVATIRIGNSFESTTKALKKTQIVIIISIPLYLLLTIFGSLFIARSSLKPVRRITKIANSIGRGDLSQRITDIESHDEIGDLADTFNEMLEKIETLFEKERLFSSAASHELRSPVAVIMAYLEAMLDEAKLDEMNSMEDIQSLERMLSESKKMNMIISQLLLLARGDEGKYKLVLERIYLNEVINAVLQQMKERAADVGITLLYYCEDNITITADQSLITQMILNLIENAIKYGKPGGHIDVFTGQTNGVTEITVSDDGIGISPDDLPHIFECFYRTDKTRDRSGSGLGLSIVDWIVKAHNGEIHVNSDVGSGTTFMISL